MISKIILLSGTGLLLGGLYFRRKEMLYQKLFQDIRKCPSFHMDYVEDAEHLPINRSMMLFGTPHSQDTSYFISSSFIKKTADENRLWKFQLKSPFKFFTGSFQPIQINSGPNQILVFNLPQTQRQIKHQGYEERAIIHGVPLCAYGKLQKNGNEYKMITELLIGNKHQPFLSFLDQELMTMMRKSKILTGMGTLLLLGHGFYFKVLGEREKTDIEKEMEGHKMK